MESQPLLVTAISIIVQSALRETETIPLSTYSTNEVTFTRRNEG